ncbi:MAG: T9SS type A sorting domain-containing protein [Bacteroidetes bacterium]|nr:T9SS type A sorting domain-containing protein [Bacteroidota bacterium]
MRHILFSLMLAIVTICQARPHLTTPPCNCDLPAPKNLQALEVGTTYATLRWDAVAGAVGYQLSLLDSEGNLIHTELTTATTVFEEDLEPALTYEYRVAAVCLGGGVSPLYSIVPLKPLIVDLVISLEKPKGIGQVICQKDILPNASCSFEIPVNQNVIGEVKRLSTGESVFFKVKFDLINNFLPHLTLSKVSEEYCPGKSFYKPRIYSNNNKLEDNNILFSYVSILNNIKLCYINFEQPFYGINSFNVIISQPLYEDLQFKLYQSSNNLNDGPNSVESKIFDKERKVTSFFPNPTSGQIRINCNSTEMSEKTAIIYSIDGVNMADFILSPGQNWLNIGSLKPGVYFCRIEGLDNYEPIKIIKME